MSRKTAFKFRLSLTATVFVSLLASNLALGASLTVNAFARYGSGTNTYGSDSVAGVSLDPNLSTGLLQANNGHLQSNAIGSGNLPGNSFGGASSWAGSSVTTGPDANRNWTLNSGANLHMEDTITVTSATLAAGTPVTVQFALAVVYSLNVYTSVPDDAPRNQALAEVSLTGSVYTGTFGDNYTLNHNYAAKSTDGPVSVGFGLFDPATPLLIFEVESEVGGELDFDLRARVATSNGRLAPYFLPPLAVTDGMASASMGVSFGADAGPDVVLFSELYNGMFPELASATTASALSGMPVSTVPLPPALLLFAGSLLLLARQRHQKGST